MSDEYDPPRELCAMTSAIVSAYLANHPMPIADIPVVIQNVYGALTGIGTTPPPDHHRQTPAVPIRKSVFQDAVVCLECGHKMKILRRHLMSNHGITVGAYRKKWGLPDNYPVVAPEYAKQRSAMAVALGLGRKR